MFRAHFVRRFCGTINKDYSYIEANKAIILGTGNTIYGHGNTIIGRSNTSYGNLVKMIGNHNCSYGSNNKLTGNYCISFGKNNSIEGLYPEYHNVGTSNLSKSTSEMDRWWPISLLIK